MNLEKIRKMEKNKKPTMKDIMSIDSRSEYVRGGHQWNLDLKKNLTKVKERKLKANAFRAWHKNNKNKNIVTFYEVVKKQRAIQDTDLRQKAEFWL